MQLFGSHKPSPEVPSLSDPCAGSVPSNGLPGSVLHSGRKKALLIGINYYGTKAQLRGCAPTPACCRAPQLRLEVLEAAQQSSWGGVQIWVESLTPRNANPPAVVGRIS